MDLEYIKNIGVKAAYNGAAVLRKYLGNLDSIDKKGPDDLVTQADIESEKEIIRTIKQRFSDHGILAEESGRQQIEKSECLWIIDPLDGTTNYAHGFPFFCISICYYVGEGEDGSVPGPAAGVVFCPVMNRASSEARKAAHQAMSSISPLFSRGCTCRKASR